LTVSVERLGSKAPGEGVTIDLCSEISRDLSAALEREDLIANAYRLEVGSPGLERALYSREDFGRFEGCLAKAKLRSPIGDQSVIRGRILGFDDAGKIRFETESGEAAVEYSTIVTARLVFDWNSPSELGGAKAKSPKPRSSERDRRNRASKRKR
jgi:ribosome maturation factor RimP